MAPNLDKKREEERELEEDDHMCSVTGFGGNKNQYL